MVLINNSKSFAKNGLEAIGLSIKKSNIIILQNVSLSLESGSFVSLVGPSGSGKTSLLRVLALLENPENGILRIHEKELDYNQGIQSCNKTAIYPRLTYVPQTLALWPHLTNRQNISFALVNSRTPLNAINVDSLCKRFDIPHILDRFPFEISQGQRQRVALARAFALNPEVILLDEPTSALDDETSIQIWNFISEFVKNGAIAFACTHDKQLADRCDKKLTIKSGTLV